MRIFHTFILTVLTCASFLLIGCSSTPSGSEGREILETTIHTNSEGLIKLVDFEKTNGQEGELFGVKIYSMEFKAEIEFASDCYWNDAFQVSTQLRPMWAQMQGLQKGTARTKQTITGTIHFEKTEEGWRGDLSSTRVLAGSSSMVQKSQTDIDPIASNRDAIINDLSNHAAQVYQYRIRPESMAGGGGSYRGYEIPWALTNNENGKYAVTTLESNSVTITGTSAKGYGSIITTIDANGRPVSWEYTGRFSTTDSQSITQSEKTGVQASRDAAINDLNLSAALAYAYRIRPKELGGGGGSYMGFNPRDRLPAGVKIVRVVANEIVFSKSHIQAVVDADGKVTIK